jgi:phosphatidylinositol-3-phosphatase
MENKSASQIIGSPQAPYINRLAAEYSLATDYSALFHPSLPNYLALTSGSNQGITDDRSPPSAGYAVSAVNLADRIEASGRSWKLYGESMPSPGYAADTTLYATRHIPFLYYKDILGSAVRRASHVVPFAQLAGDLRAASTTPAFAFITPNLCSDMHDCPVATGDAWLSRVVPRILHSPAFTTTRSLLVITWDEGTGSDNHVATILAGSAAKLGYRSGRPYDHYSLLHTIEAVWGLKPLTRNDARAATMGAFLRK